MILILNNFKYIHNLKFPVSVRKLSLKYPELVSSNPQSYYVSLVFLQAWLHLAENVSCHFLSLEENTNAVIVSRFHISREGGGVSKREIQFSFSIFNLLSSTFPKVMNKIFLSTCINSGLLTSLDRQGLQHSDKRNSSDGTRTAAKVEWDPFTFTFFNLTTAIQWWRVF